MFTAIDKALVALFGAILFLVNHFGGLDLGISEDVIAALVAVITPILTYLIPNKAE